MTALGLVQNLTSGFKDTENSAPETSEENLGICRADYVVTLMTERACKAPTSPIADLRL